MNDGYKIHQYLKINNYFYSPELKPGQGAISFINAVGTEMYMRKPGKSNITEFAFVVPMLCIIGVAITFHGCRTLQDGTIIMYRCYSADTDRLWVTGGCRLGNNRNNTKSDSGFVKLKYIGKSDYFPFTCIIFSCNRPA